MSTIGRTLPAMRRGRKRTDWAIFWIHTIMLAILLAMAMFAVFTDWYSW